MHPFKKQAKSDQKRADDRYGKFCTGGYADGGSVGEPQPSDLYSKPDLANLSMTKNMGVAKDQTRYGDGKGPNELGYGAARLFNKEKK